MRAVHPGNWGVVTSLHTAGVVLNAKAGEDQRLRKRHELHSGPAVRGHPELCEVPMIRLMLGAHDLEVSCPARHRVPLIHLP